MATKSMLEAVVPGVQGRVIGALLRLDAPETISHIAGLAHVSRDRAAEVVAELDRLGLVERRAAGRSWLVAVVDEHPVVEALRQIEDTHDRTLTRLRESAASIRPRPLWMAVFGSWATGHSTPESDLDIAVVAPEAVDEERDRFLAEVERWATHAQRVTGLVPSLIVADSPDETKGPLWDSARRDAVVLVDASEGRHRGA